MAMPKLMILSRLLVTVIITLLALTSQGKNVLLTDERLYSGQSLDEGSYSLRMQNSCNLALFDGSKAIWASNPGSSIRGCFAVMQGDGNFIIYTPNSAFVWHSSTWQPSPRPFQSILLLQGNRNLVIYGPVLWDAGTNKNSVGGVVHTVVNGTAGDGGYTESDQNNVSTMVVGEISGQDAFTDTKERNVLLSGQKLDVGQSLEEGSYSLRMQNSCNLALFEGSKAVWTSNTGSPNRRCTAHLQTDGNFVIYTSNGTVVWATNRRRTQGNYVLVLQPNRNIAIYGPDRWSTRTNIRSIGGIVHAMVNCMAAAAL